MCGDSLWGSFAFAGLALSPHSYEIVMDIFGYWVLDCGKVYKNHWPFNYNVQSSYSFVYKLWRCCRLFHVCSSILFTMLPLFFCHAINVCYSLIASDNIDRHLHGHVNTRSIQQCLPASDYARHQKFNTFVHLNVSWLFSLGFKALRK